MIEERFPWIKWREPIAIRNPGGPQRFACRICIARFGLKGREVGDLWETPEEVLEHIKAAH